MNRNTSLRIMFMFLALIATTDLVSAQTSQSDFNFKEPADTTKLVKLNLWATQYFIPQFKSKGKIPLVYDDGTASGLFLDTCNFCEAALEGTAYIKDSMGIVTVVNFAKRGDTSYVNCRKCAKYANSKLAVESWGKTQWTKSSRFGDGVKNYKLVPYRTIAVDPTKIPYGTVIFIPKVKGKIVELPNGVKVTHDGYFLAGDTGGAIKENHIDIFTGINSKNPFPTIICSDPKKNFNALVVIEKDIIDKVTDLHSK